jgi:DNA polymerase sigma
MSDKRQNEIDEFVGKLENLLRDELNLPQINLELFGSVKSGFGDDSCDLDICLVDTGIPLENVNGKNIK